MKLDEKVALITGASRGIGRAISKTFALEGAKVAINYNKSEKDALSLAEEIKDQSGKTLLVKADVSKSDEVKRMVRKTVENFDRIDILVNNAGILIPVTFLDTTEQIWDKTMEINIKGAFLCSKEIAPIMLNQGKGKIINIASISGLAERAAVRDTAYVVSKSALIGLTRSLAVNLGPDISVNAICPGLTDTDMATSLGHERVRVGVEESILKRIAKPEDIARTALFLASDDSDIITGEILTLAGGKAMR
ncbi:MAG: 3-oxoacyl-ACP reductase FabG [Candidatus Bathyarchaeota archaeon]|nr:3-oxoacyl-ACP reductase FabG [Candidatus Bathyarchaeota archaeon]